MDRYGYGLRDVERLYAPMRDAHRFLEARDPPPKRSTTDNLLAGFEVAAGAAAVGFLAGWTGGPDILGTGIPLGLSLGLLGHALTLLDVVPAGLEDHVHNVSNGAIAGWAAIWALGEGAVAARDAQRGAAAGLPPQHHADPQPVAAVRGLPPGSPRALPPAPPRPGALNEAELQAVMMQSMLRRAA